MFQSQPSAYVPFIISTSSRPQPHAHSVAYTHNQFDGLGQLNNAADGEGGGYGYDNGSSSSSVLSPPQQPDLSLQTPQQGRSRAAAGGPHVDEAFVAPTDIGPGPAFDPLSARSSGSFHHRSRYPPHHQHQHQQHQLITTSAHNIAIKQPQPGFRHPFQLSAGPDCVAKSYPHARPALKMDENPAMGDDIAAQEAAARDYQPDLKGPPVGNKTPSHVITEEYAKADPTYVAKTMALPQTYSHYRPMLGDGNCGWRAIAFGFFEAIIRTQDPNKLETERRRLEQLKPYLSNVGGFDPAVWEDMADETFGLISQLQASFRDTEAAMAVLMDRFNDLESANAIIYHIRLLASSWLKGHRELYESFLSNDRGVDGYSQEVIERPFQEIDHLGLTILFAVLLEPAGIVLEIAYLDRTEGDQVNTYRYPDAANNQDASKLGPLICLLYRPDHYDILYRHTDLATAPPVPADVQVHRVSFDHGLVSGASELTSYPAVDMTTLTILPDFIGGHTGLATLGNASASPMAEYSPSPSSPWMATPFTDPFSNAPNPVARYAAAPQTPQCANNHPVRFTKYNYPQLIETTPASILPIESGYSTASFKHSHFNKAHYNNPEFQPEEYRPGVDD